MSIESLLVTLFFVLPGFISLRVYEWFVATRSQAPLEVTSWSIAISLLAAAPYVAIPQTRPLMTYLWQAPELSPDTLLGIALQTATALILGAFGAILVLRVFRGRLGRWSFYQRSWDWLWGSFGTDMRFIQVTTDAGKYFGALSFADEPSTSRDIVLRDPAIWLQDEDRFFRSGMKYMLIPGSSIRTIELSIANPPSSSDDPYMGFGYVGDQPEGPNEGQENVK